MLITQYNDKKELKTKKATELVTLVGAEGFEPPTLSV
jgi:hypothetical protein